MECGSREVWKRGVEVECGSREVRERGVEVQCGSREVWKWSVKFRFKTIENHQRKLRFIIHTKI